MARDQPALVRDLIARTEVRKIDIRSRVLLTRGSFVEFVRRKEENEHDVWPSGSHQKLAPFCRPNSRGKP